VGLRAGLDRCGKSRPTGIRSPDRPARRQSLYRLRYPAHLFQSIFSKKEENEPLLIFAVTALATAVFHDLLHPLVERLNFIST